MQMEIPYFMTSVEWYEFDDKLLKYVLTPEAPQKAINSYKEFYKALEQQKDK